MVVFQSHIGTRCYGRSIWKQQPEALLGTLYNLASVKPPRCWAVLGCCELYRGRLGLLLPTLHFDRNQTTQYWHTCSVCECVVPVYSSLQAYESHAD